MEFIKSFLLWAMLVTHNISIYICKYISKVSYIHYFLLSSTVMVFLYCMLNILRYEKIFVKLTSRLIHNIIHQVMRYFWVFIVNPFSLLLSIFFLRKLCFLWSPCLLFIAESIILDTSGKPNVGLFLKINSLSWIILSISLDKINSVDWLLKSYDEFSWNFFILLL